MEYNPTSLCVLCFRHHACLHVVARGQSFPDPNPDCNPNTRQVAAPGGDGVYQIATEAQNGEVLSTWPSSAALTDDADFALLTDGVGGRYGYLQVGSQLSAACSHSLLLAKLRLAASGRPTTMSCHPASSVTPIGPCDHQPSLDSWTSARSFLTEGLSSQGTSMAAPHVAGVAALIISRTASKRMTPAQVAAALIRTASPKACPKRECRVCIANSTSSRWIALHQQGQHAAENAIKAAYCSTYRPSTSSMLEPNIVLMPCCNPSMLSIRFIPCSCLRARVLA